jgi:hypothetical protein
MPTRDQMNMDMEDRLTRIVTNVYAYIEPRHVFVDAPYLRFHLVQESMYGVSLRAIELEEIRDVPLREDERVIFRYWIPVANREAKLVLGDNPTLIDSTEHAVRLAVIVAYRHAAKVGIIAVALCGITRVAERLKVGIIV